jgi:hypothetical protein
MNERVGVVTPLSATPRVPTICPRSCIAQWLTRIPRAYVSPKKRDALLASHVRCLTKMSQSSEVLRSPRREGRRCPTKATIQLERQSLYPSCLHRSLRRLCEKCQRTSRRRPPSGF